jgi:hypothetical protein
MVIGMHQKLNTYSERTHFEFSTFAHKGFVMKPPTHSAVSVGSKGRCNVIHLLRAFGARVGLHSCLPLFTYIIYVYIYRYESRTYSTDKRSRTSGWSARKQECMCRGALEPCAQCDASIFRSSKLAGVFSQCRVLR